MLGVLCVEKIEKALGPTPMGATGCGLSTSPRTDADIVPVLPEVERVEGLEGRLVSHHIDVVLVVWCV